MKSFSYFAMVVLAITTAVLATLPVESLRITAAAATAICSLIAFIGTTKSAKENSRLKQRVSALEEDRENAATTREREARDETERLKKLSGELQAKLCDIREKTDAAKKEHSSLLSSNSDIAATLEDEKRRKKLRSACIDEIARMRRISKSDAETVYSEEMQNIKSAEMKIEDLKSEIRQLERLRNEANASLMRSKNFASLFLPDTTKADDPEDLLTRAESIRAQIKRLEKLRDKEWLGGASSYGLQPKTFSHNRVPVYVVLRQKQSGCYNPAVDIELYDMAGSRINVLDGLYHMGLEVFQIGHETELWHAWHLHMEANNAYAELSKTIELLEKKHAELMNEFHESVTVQVSIENLLVASTK